MRRHAWGVRRQLGSQRLGLFACGARRHDPVDEPDPLGLLGVHGPAGQDQVHRTARPDQPWQPDRPAVDERDAPASAEDTERRVRGGNPEVAPQGELETAGDGVPLHRRDDRLAEPQPGRTHRPVAVRHHPVVQRTQVGTGTERATRAGQHRHRLPVVGVERTERVGELRGRGPVDGVAHVRPVDDDGRDRTGHLDAHVHAASVGPRPVRCGAAG